MNITDSIRFIDDFGRDLSRCQFKVTLDGGHHINVPLMEGVELIERFFMNGKVTPKEALVFHRDVTRIMRHGKVQSHLVSRINEFLAICQSHIDLMRKDERADDVADGTTTANEARDSVGLDPIEYNVTESHTAKIVKIDDVPLEASKTTFRLPSTMFTCVVGGEKQSYVVINDK